MTRMSKTLFVLVSMSAALAIALAVRPAPRSPPRIELTPEQVTALKPQPAPAAVHERLPPPPGEEDAEEGASETPEDGEGS